MTIPVYSVLLLWLQNFVEGPVPLFIIFGTRLLLLLPFLGTQLKLASLEQTWILRETIHGAYWISKAFSAYWGALFVSTGPFAWKEANGNPAIRTLAYDLILSILSINANSGVWDEFL